MNPKQMTVDSPVVTESEIKHFSSWGEELLLPEWNESTCYREQQGWKVRLQKDSLDTNFEFNVHNDNSRVVI
jgi:hypothetical protein